MHHALVRILEPIFDKTFIHDSCANRKNKGNLFALQRFYKFIRKVSRNGTAMKNNFQDSSYIYGYCLKADIKHYFQEVNHEILLNTISSKISDGKVLHLIEKIIKSEGGERQNGMPLGNLTSQFFANIYLNELDYFVKHKLKAKYYIRYVDDFVILYESREQLEIWKKEIDNFLRNRLRLELHSEKSKIICLSKGIDFVGFRNFYYFKLLRKRNVRKFFAKVRSFELQKISCKEMLEIFQGWNAYAKWANCYELRRRVNSKIHKVRFSKIETNKSLFNSK